MNNENKMSKKDMDSHIKILGDNINKDKFEGVNLTGSFEEPALVIVLDKMPGKASFNILKNTVSFSEDNPTYLYIHVAEKTYKLGKIQEGIDQVYVIKELFSRFGLKMVKVEEGSKRVVTHEDYITTMEL